jgi:hypothetical protein
MRTNAPNGEGRAALACHTSTISALLNTRWRGLFAPMMSFAMPRVIGDDCSPYVSRAIAQLKSFDR